MTWQLDRSKTRLEFSVKHMLIHTVRGCFEEFEADLDLHEQDLSKSSAKARVSTKSVSTRDRLRDEYLTSKDFFNPAEFPHILFESTSLRVSGNKVSVSGRLKIRNRENQLILNGTVVRPSAPVPSAPVAGQMRRLTFDLTGEIPRESYDLVFNGAVETVSVVVAKKVALALHIEIIES